MGSTYTGIRYLTGRRLTFRSDLPINRSAVRLMTIRKLSIQMCIRKVENA